MSATRAEFTQRRLVRFSEGAGAKCSKEFLAWSFTPKAPRKPKNALPGEWLLTAMVRGFRKAFVRKLIGGAA